MYYPDVNIDKATVVRYVLKDSEGRYTETGTKVYFVDFQNKDGYKNLNIVSIVTTPSNLYDNETGIFVDGKKVSDPIKFNLKDVLAQQEAMAKVDMSADEAELDFAVE